MGKNFSWRFGSTRSGEAHSLDRFKDSRRIWIVAAGVILAAAVALLAWGQASGGVPVALAQDNSPATGTATLTGTSEIHYAVTVSVSGVVDADGITDDNNDLVPDDLTYDWYYDGRVVSDFTDISAASIVINYRAVRKQVSVIAKFRDDEGNIESLESNATSTIPSGAIIEANSVGAPTEYDISNNADVGRTLRANIDNVNYPDLASTPTFQYQWIYWDSSRVGLFGKLGDISGATGQSFTIAESNIGKFIQLELTFSCVTSFDSCSSGTRTTFSNFRTEFVEIPPASLAVTSAAISGDPEVNTELTATISDVYGVTDPVYSYRWYAAPQGQTLSTVAHRIRGESGMTYTPTHAEIGKRIVASAHYEDDFSSPLSATSPATEPVRSSASIVAASGFYVDEVISADTSSMNLRGLPDPSTFTYQWIHVEANGAFEDDAAGTPSDTQSYALSTADDGKYIQVEITFTPTDPPGNTPRTVVANMQTPEIAERPPAESAENLRAQVANKGGSVRLTWGITSTGSALPSKFQYRYKPTDLLATTPFADTDWEDVSGRGSARSLTITGTLINVAEYTFELRSVDRLGFATQEVSDTATYRHKTRGCPET